MKKVLILLLALAGGIQSNAQITFRGCEGAVLGPQDFVLTQTETTNDAGTIRNTYESMPDNFQQSCPSGNCEVRIQWNIGAGRWEIQLDNDGPLNDANYTTAVMYYNTTPSEPNPPSLNLGNWVDNLGNACGGTLTPGNSTLTGDVQDVTLSTDDLTVLSNSIRLHPNPATDVLSITSGSFSLKSVTFYSMIGAKVATITSEFQSIDVSNLPSQLYLVKVETNDDKSIVKKLVVK